MLEFIYITTIALLAAIVYQDFKDRLISAYLLVSILGMAIALGLCYCEGKELLLNLSFNLAFIAIQGIVLFVYFRFLKGVKNIQQVLGLGDMLFIAVITVFFSPFNFVLFYVISLILTIIAALLMALPQRQKSIPLAGFMAAQLIVALVIQYTHIFILCKESLIS